MSEHRIGKFLKATQEPTDRDGWRIHNNRRQILGVVDYEPHWREYVFNPLPNTCYSQECLCDIQQFLIRINNAKAKGSAINEYPKTL